MVDKNQHQPALEVAQVLGVFGTPIFVDLISRAQVLVADYGYEELDFELVNLVMSYQGTYEAGLLDEANIIVRKHMGSLLLQHGIALDEDAELDTVLDILEAVLRAPTWYNPEDIERILAMDCTNEERVIELARTIKDPRNNKYTTAVQAVNSDFIKKIQDIMIDGFSIDPDEITLEKEQVDAVRAYKQFVDKAACFQLLHLGYQIGSSCESYLRRAAGMIAAKNNQEAAKEIVGFLLFSRDGWRSPLKAWDDHNQVLNLELNDLASLGVEVKRLLSDFDTYKVKNP